MGVADSISKIPKLALAVYNLTENIAKVQGNVEKLQEQNVKILERLAPAEERLKQLEKHVEKQESTIQQQQDKILKLENEIATLKARQEDKDKIHLQELAINKLELEKSISAELQKRLSNLRVEVIEFLQTQPIPSTPPVNQTSLVTIPKTYLPPGGTTQIIDDGES